MAFEIEKEVQLHELPLRTFVISENVRMSDGQGIQEVSNVYHAHRTNITPSGGLELIEFGAGDSSWVTQHWALGSWVRYTSMVPPAVDLDIYNRYTQQQAQKANARQSLTLPAAGPRH